MQAAGGRQVQLARTAPNFQEDGGQFRQCRRLVGNPKRVGKPVWPCDQKVAGAVRPQLADAGEIGQAAFQEDVGGADPQDWTSSGGLRQEQPGQAEREARDRAGVVASRAMDFGQGPQRQAAADGGIEIGGTGGEELTGPRFGTAQENAAGKRRYMRILQPLGQPALDPRYVPAQACNHVPRHGVHGHGA